VQVDHRACLQAGLPAAMTALLADPTERCRLAALKVLLADQFADLRQPGVLIPAIAARFGCKADGDSESGPPADSSEDVRLAAVKVLSRLLQEVPTRGLVGLSAEQLAIVGLSASEISGKLAADELHNVVAALQRAMADPWVDVRKVQTVTIPLLSSDT
jgi:HEAT repeat protein